MPLENFRGFSLYLQEYVEVVHASYKFILKNCAVQRVFFSHGQNIFLSFPTSGMSLEHTELSLQEVLCYFAGGKLALREEYI
jgi:hypothetical protein